MSYTILYRTMNIRLKDNTYVPVCESGDNNVWECDNHRRARSWSTFSFFGKKLSYTEDEILAAVDASIQKIVEQCKGKDRYSDTIHTEEDIRKHFGWYDCVAINGGSTSSCSATAYRNWFIKGMRNSVTFDYLNDWGVGVKIYYKYGEPCVFVNSEEELRREFDRILAEGYFPYVCYHCVTDLVYEVACPKKKKAKVQHTKGYAVRLATSSWGGATYVYKMTSRRMFSSGSPHIYTSKKSADEVMAKVKRYWPGSYDPCVVTMTRDDEKSNWKVA